MKHAPHFKTFLDNEVNLNETRLTQLKKRVEAVYKALGDDDRIGDLVLGKIRQGSWPQRTIIKPKAGKDFDADFLLKLDWNEDWADNPSKYPNAIYGALGRNSTYAEMHYGRGCHSVFLEYARDSEDIGCHLDIVAHVVDPYGRKLIVNRDDDEFEEINPEGFTDWMKQRDDAAKGNLRTVIRLMKYYKARKGSFNGVRSMILTTLLGEQVNEFRASIDPAFYADIPTTLLRLVTSLDEYLQLHETMPSLSDPGGMGTFDHRWTQETYANFRTRMHAAAAAITAAYEEEDDFDRSVALWQDVFGEAFKPTPPATSSAKFAGAAATGALGSFGGRSGKSG